MFTTISRAGVGMYSFLLFTLLSYFDLEVTQSQVDEVVIAVGTVASFIVWVWGQVRRDDLAGGLMRK